MSLPLYIVDAFADGPFTGNPAAVCLLDGARPDNYLHQVAAEMNLSETAFLLRNADETYRLRWLTPKMEVDLCGHATLAAAHVLWSTGRIADDQESRFHTRSGILTCRQMPDRFIQMDFPAEPPVDIPDAPAEALLAALGTPPESAKIIGRKMNRMDYLVELDSCAALRALVPDFVRLATLPVRGTIVTARSDDGRFDFLSRFFAPKAGVNEDPVTGSAHCCLAPYWAEKLGKTSMRAYQASSRGGTLHLEVRGARVLISGQAHTVAEGKLLA